MNMCRCGRKDFLFGLLGTAALTGVPSKALADFYGALPKSTPAGAIPNKKGAVKVRLVFSLFDEVQVRKTWPRVGFDFRPVLKNVADALNAGVKDVEFIPGQAFDAKTVDALLAEDEKRGDIAGYLVIQMNSWPEAAPELAKKTSKPLLFCSFPYSGIGGWCVFNSTILKSGRKDYAFMSSMVFADTIGVAQAFAALKQGSGADFVKAATDYRLAHTPKAYSSLPAKEGEMKCLSPEETLKRVKGMKILALERPSKHFIPKDNLAEDLGIIVENVSFKELDDAWAKCSEERAKPLFDDWKNNANKIEGVDDATLMGCARMYFAMDDVLKAHQAQAITVDCLGGCYQGALHAYPCLGFMELQDHGLMGTCESDLGSTVTMLVMSVMTGGRMGYISDPAIDSSRRSIIYAHCVSTRRFFGPDSKKVPFEILTHAEDQEGASVRAIAPTGYPVTTLEIHPDKKAIVLSSAFAYDNDPDDRACRTKIVCEVKGDFERIYRHWDTYGWHRVTVYGDCRKGVEALAKHLGYRVDYES